MDTPPYVGFSQLECYRQWYLSSYHFVLLVSFILKDPYPAKVSSSYPYHHVPHTHKEEFDKKTAISVKRGCQAVAVCTPGAVGTAPS